MRAIAALVSSLLVLGIVVSDSHAAPIAYTLSGVGSGMLGNQPFSSASFVITSLADTSEIIVERTLYTIPNSSAAVSISGLPKAKFTVFTTTFANTNVRGAGIRGETDEFSINDMVDIFQSSFSNYHLNTSFGPVTGLAGINPDLVYATDASNLSFSHVSTVTFQARLVPEPTSTVLFLIGTSFAFVTAVRHSAAS